MNSRIAFEQALAKQERKAFNPRTAFEQALKMAGQEVLAMPDPVSTLQGIDQNLASTRQSIGLTEMYIRLLDRSGAGITLSGGSTNILRLMEQADKAVSLAQRVMKDIV